MSNPYKRTYGSSALIRYVDMAPDVFSAMLKNLILQTTSALLQEFSVKPGEQVSFTMDTGLARNPQHPGCHELQVEASMQVYVGQRDKQPKPLPAYFEPGKDPLI